MLGRFEIHADGWPSALGPDTRSPVSYLGRSAPQSNLQHPPAQPTQACVWTCGGFRMDMFVFHMTRAQGITCGKRGLERGHAGAVGQTVTAEQSSGGWRFWRLQCMGLGVWTTAVEDDDGVGVSPLPPLQGNPSFGGGGGDATHPSQSHVPRRRSLSLYTAQLRLDRTTAGACWRCCTYQSISKARCGSQGWCRWQAPAGIGLPASGGSGREVLEGGEGGGEGVRRGGRGFGRTLPPPRVPLWSPPKAGRKFNPEILKSSRYRRRRSKSLAVSLKYYKRRREGGRGSKGRGVRGGSGEIPPLLLRCTAVLMHPCVPGPFWTSTSPA